LHKAHFKRKTHQAKTNLGRNAEAFFLHPEADLESGHKRTLQKKIEKARSYCRARFFSHGRGRPAPGKADTSGHFSAQR
jgi:hypothetical protein